MVAVTLTTAPYIATITITITASLLGMLVLSVYKQWQLGVLEGCFIVNLAVFSSGTYGVNKDSLACTSLGVAFSYS